MNMASAFRMFVECVVIGKKLPLEISEKFDPFYSKENLERLQRSIEQMERTGGTIRKD